MGEILSQLGRLFVQTIPTVIFVFLLLIILDRLFFKPLARVLDERQSATTGALARARELGAESEEKFHRYEESLRAARQENYRLREEARKGALAEREEALRHARQQAETFLKEARANLAAQAEETRIALRLAIQPLAAEITDRALSAGEMAGSEGDNRA